jgi:hypothetical protein
MKKQLQLIIFLFSFIGFSQVTENKIVHRKFTKLSEYKELYGSNFTKQDSLSFVFVNNDTLIPLPEKYNNVLHITVPYEPKDEEFLKIYKDIVYKKSSQFDTLNRKILYMKYWKKPIKIFFTENVSDYIKNDLKTFTNNLSSKIDSLSIAYVNNIEDANYIIYNYESEKDVKYEEKIKGNSTNYYEWWNKNKQITRCKLQINESYYDDKNYFISTIKYLFINSLGNFNYTYLLPSNSYFSAVPSRTKEFTDYDFEILKYHYSYGICKGTDLETFEEQHEKAIKTFKETGTPLYFGHTY